MKGKTITGFSYLIFWVLAVSLLAENSKKIDTQMLSGLKHSVNMDADTRNKINSITNNDVQKLVLNRDLVNNHNDVFNVKVDVKGITNQRSTGRCWMFACLNLMRPAAIEKFNISSFEFSQSYLFFWDKIEKSNFFLETIIETREKDIDDRELQSILSGPAADGGWFNYAVSLIEKYGVVPQNFMPETENSKNSRQMNHIIENLLRQNAARLRQLSREGKNESFLRKQKIDMLKDIYRLLVLHLGTPPEQFEWRYEDKSGAVFNRTYTPLRFYREAVGFDLSNYITIVDHAAYPYNSHYRLKYCRNMVEAPDMNFINLDISRLKEFALKSLLNKEPVWFAGDTGWQMERDHGIMADGIYDYESLYGVKIDMSKGEKLRYRVLTPSHAMVLIAVDTIRSKPVKWRVENSWGADIGNKGYWALYDSWFDKYVLTVIINKKYLPENVNALLKTKPKELPHWDPMRSFFQ